MFSQTTRMNLRVDHIAFRYHDLPVLRDVSFDVPSGDFLSLLGPNGSGKSTLLKLLNRILLPGEGNISLGDRPLNTLRRSDIARTVAYVPQDGLWVFPFTVLEVVLMGRSPYLSRFGFEGANDIELAHAVMSLVDIDHLAMKPITALSGGERQRVLIARALCQQPRILLLDEPNAHLDIAHQIDIFQILRREHEKGLTILSVSHDLNLAATFSKRIMLLAPQHPDPGPAGESADGRERRPFQRRAAGSTIVALGTPEDVLTESNIQSVFHARVLVDRHPQASSIRISLIPEQIMEHGNRAR
ncbi:MAG: ABC transporter ATP-binding protein [Ignavibacteriales bacterium]|nr:ABC transporter ATP-binding protein [Ignavibacteriales bacterium]